jgi:hypothetical protein
MATTSAIYLQSFWADGDPLRKPVISITGTLIDEQVYRNFLLRVANIDIFNYY